MHLFPPETSYLNINVHKSSDKQQFVSRCGLTVIEEHSNIYCLIPLCVRFLLCSCHIEEICRCGNDLTLLQHRDKIRRWTYINPSWGNCFSAFSVRSSGLPFWTAPGEQCRERCLAQGQLGSTWSCRDLNWWPSSCQAKSLSTFATTALDVFVSGVNPHL